MSDLLVGRTETAAAHPGVTCCTLDARMTISTRCVPLLLCLALWPTSVGAQQNANTGTSPDLSRGPAPGDQYPNTIYRYRNKRGRAVFTNIWDQIPANQRSHAEKMDLSHITLNPQLGAELDASMQTQFEIASASAECKKVKAQATHWMKPIWDDYGHLIILGAVMLLLLLATPFALRQVDAPVWARTLTRSFMLLAFVGVFMHTTVRAGKMYQSMRDAAAPCERETWEATATQKDGRMGKLKLLADLQGMIRQAQSQTEQDRLHELDKLLQQ